MESPGVFDLVNQQIGAAAGPTLLTPIEGLDGMTSVTLWADFRYGSGGSAVVATVVTSFDDGVTWAQIARFEFDAASAIKTVNLAANTSGAMVDYADLVSGDHVTGNLLGNQLAVRLTSTGAYVNTTLAIRAAVR